MKTVDKRRGQAGFTLIEIIAVLVILAVLAAVAIPRYVSLMDDARTRALDGALAAGLSHVSMAYGRLALQNGVEPTDAELVAECTATPMQSTDYTFVFAAAAGGGVDVTATDNNDAAVTDTRTWARP
ncbi:MAG TPA: prepilin-type N-terminal cleavage/methylation domain-containing protein [Kiritimatiellia bacterium]|nr:prepilin-type N-terminal cleavage/methylation domain-containing protein [Kiritimatiellia bacterium]